MSGFSDAFLVLQLQMNHKTRLTAMLRELRGQETVLQKKVAQLLEIKQREQMDVERLEGRSLAAFFYYISGKQEEKLDRERQEAYVARVKYDAALRELEAIRHDIREAEEDLASLGDLDIRMKQLMEEKSEAIRTAGTPASQRLLDTEQSISFLRGQERELREAISAGREALTITDAILDNLSSAENWGTFDLLGGGILADMVKHDHLDEAQEHIEELQVQLQRFNKELSDVTIRANLQVRIDSMLRFADCFLDNLLTDVTVLDKINQARVQVTATREEVLAILRKLTDTLESVSHRLVREDEVLDALILNTEVEA